MIRNIFSRIFRDEVYFEWGPFAQSLTKLDLFALCVGGGFALYLLATVWGYVIRGAL